MILSYEKRLKDATRPGILFDRWRDVFDRPLYHMFFEPPHEVTTTSSAHTTVERFIAFLMTVVYIAILPDEEKQLLKEKVLAIMEKGDGVLWIDKSQSLFEIPQRNVAISMRKKSD